MRTYQLPELMGKHSKNLIRLPQRRNPARGQVHSSFRFQSANRPPCDRYEAPPVQHKQDCYLLSLTVWKPLCIILKLRRYLMLCLGLHGISLMQCVSLLRKQGTKPIYTPHFQRMCANPLASIWLMLSEKDLSCLKFRLRLAYRIEGQKERGFSHFCLLMEARSVYEAMAGLHVGLLRGKAVRKIDSTSAHPVDKSAANKAAKAI